MRTSPIVTSFSVAILGTATAFSAIQPPVQVPETPGNIDSPPVEFPVKLLGPDELSAIYEIGIAWSDIQAFTVTRRLQDLRRPPLEIPVEGKAPDYKEYKRVSEPDGKTTKNFKETASGAPESRWGGFLTGSATRLDLEHDSVADGYGISIYGLTAGIDYRVTDQLTLGLLFGYANSDVDLHGGDISAHIGTLGIYGSWVNDGFYVNGLVAGSYGEYDTRRRGFGGHANGDTDGFSFTSLLSTGYDFHRGPWTFGPFVDVQYTSVQFDGFREHGSDFPLVIEDNRSDSLRSRIGARVSRCFQLGYARVCPELALSWQHEYLDRSRPIDAHFARGSDRSFRVEGPRMGRDSLVVNASVTFLHNDRWSSYLAYDAVLARDDYEAHTISGGVRVNF